MKKSIINDIYYGKRGHNETIKESKEYWNIMDRVEELVEKFENKLSKEQKELFRKLNFEESGLEAEAALAHFKEGFKLGLLIGIECMED